MLKDRNVTEVKPAGKGLQDKCVISTSIDYITGLAWQKFTIRIISTLIGYAYIKALEFYREHKTRIYLKKIPLEMNSVNLPGVLNKNLSF